MTKKAIGVAGACLLIAIIVAGGGVVRLIYLDESAFRADTIEFYRHGLAGTDPVDLWENPPWPDQIPFGESISLYWLRIFNVEATHYSIRLPFALIGTLSIAAAIFFCRKLFGIRIALLAGVLCALNPFHVYISRESYHYVGVAFFSILSTWAFWNAWMYMLREKKVSVGRLVVWLAASLVTCHTHMSTWPVLVGQWSVFAVSGIKHLRTDKKQRAYLGISLSAVGIIALIVLLPWIRNVREGSGASFKTAYRAGQWKVIVDVVADLLPSLTFGASWWGYCLLLLLLAGGGWLLIKTRWERDKVRALGILCVVEFCFLLFVMAVVGKGRASTHYFSPLWPCVLVLFAVFVAAVARKLSSVLRGGEGLWLVVMAALLAGYWAVPLWATVRLEGKPKPYKEIVAAIERHLAPGTPVLVDRHWEAIVEMGQFYPPKDRPVTFLTPSEPVDAYVNGQWRERAMSFFGQYPTAGYLEVLNSYETEPKIGPWEWPDRYFRNHVRITNEAGLVLRKWHFAPRGGFYTPNTNGLVVTLHYNTREDIPALARLAGARTYILYGPEWGFVRLGDYWEYSMWHTMQEKGTVDVYNFTGRSLLVKLKVHAVAVQGNKTILLDGREQRLFPNGVQQTWDTSPINLDPGGNRVTFTDTKWLPGGGGGIALVAGIRVVELAAE